MRSRSIVRDSEKERVEWRRGGREGGERESERERQTDRQTDKDTDTETERGVVKNRMLILARVNTILLKYTL